MSSLHGPNALSPHARKLFEICAAMASHILLEDGDAAVFVMDATAGITTRRELVRSLQSAPRYAGLAEALGVVLADLPRDQVPAVVFDVSKQRYYAAPLSRIAAN